MGLRNRRLNLLKSSLIIAVAIMLERGVIA